jgi:hypothetical protein
MSAEPCNEGQPAAAPLKIAALAGRIFVAIVGCYFAVDLTMACLALVLPPATGMARGDAVILASLLAFPAYAAMMLWTFAQRGLMRLTFSVSIWVGVAFLLSRMLGVILHPPLTGTI